MKRLPVISIISFILFASGYMVGKSMQAASSVEPACESNQSNGAQDIPVEQTVAKAQTVSRTDFDDVKPEYENVDILQQLTSTAEDDRMNALFYIWRTNLVSAFDTEIQTLAQDDQNQQIGSFAKWILNPSDDTANIEQQQSAPGRDEHVAESQLLAALIKNSSDYQQSDQKLSESKKDLDSMYLLSEKEQLAYVKELSRSQDDAAIDELAGLVSIYNENIKNAAIEELLSLLELRTGHFDKIISILNINQANLSEDQVQRFVQLSTKTTRTAVETDIDILDILDKSK